MDKVGLPGAVPAQISRRLRDELRCHIVEDWAESRIFAGWSSPGGMSLYPRKLRGEIVRFAVRNYELRTAETVMETLSGPILTGWGANVTGISQKT